MLVDKFMASLGIVDIDIPDEAKALLKARVCEFFRGGGSIRWAEWLEMEDVTREIFTAAKEQVDKEQAVRVLDGVTTLVDQMLKA